MDRAVWQQAQEIFHKVVELEGDQQETALRELCGGDAALLEQLQSMLEEDRRNDFVLDNGIAAVAESFVGSSEEQHWQHVEQVGPYRIERLLGEGGMGIVYLAERTDIGGRVAIKLLRDAWVSPARRRRFASEQRTLAQLNHPGIAQLFDADALPDGTPWFVMEYVDGLPLTEYWNARKGTVKECLWLFRGVCEAVQYAHQRAVIHRDLKPSNILVTAERRVKLLDFGIAKHLDENVSGADGNATLTGLRPMTPAYAAPEQLSGGALGVYTDVYALGVLLYQLLTGEMPFDETAISHAGIRPEPRRPSSVAESDRFAAHISRSEWADLNVLCLTAMRSEPERRYQSVEAMIRDLDAFIEKRPLAARDDHWSYKLRKFVVRRRVRLAYGAATLAVVAGLIGYFTFRLSEARDGALAEAARTERIQQFTANLFRGNESNVGPADDLRVTTLLERGRTEAASLSGDPDMQADMWETLGDIYRKLGDTVQADALLTSSLERRHAQQKTQPQKYAKNLIELGLLRMDEAKLDQAEQMVRQGLELSKQTSPVTEDGIRLVEADAMVALGSVLEAKGSYDEAVNILSGALKLRPRSDAPNAGTAANLRELANVNFYQGRYTVAQSLNEQALAIHRSLYGEKHPEVAEDLNNLGAIQHEIGNLPAAETKYRSSLAITEQWYGPDHAKTAQDLTSLGRTLVIEGKFEEGKATLERALSIQKTIHGHDHPAVASALNELGNMYSMEQKYAEALLRFGEALEIWRTVYGNHHQFIGVGLSNLGSVYMAEKNFSKAEEMFRQAIEGFRETVGENHPNTAIGRIKLGRTLLRQKRYADAEPETLRGYQTLAKLVAPTNGFLKAAKLDLTQIYSGLNRKTDADVYRTQ
jgi:serine/threonine-protein kinase